MTDKELEELANQYSLEFANCMAERNKNYMPPNVIPEIWRESQKEVPKMLANMYQPFVKWLLQNYDIVAKEKVREEYDKAENEDATDTRFWIESRGKLRLLESLFPTLKSD